jgi:hypothetical protein
MRSYKLVQVGAAVPNMSRKTQLAGLTVKQGRPSTLCSPCLGCCCAEQHTKDANEAAKAVSADIADDLNAEIQQVCTKARRSMRNSIRHVPVRWFCPLSL